MNIINFLIYSVGTSVLCVAVAAVAKIIIGNRKRAAKTRAQCENCWRLRRIERNWLGRRTYKCDGRSGWEYFHRPPEYCNNFRPREPEEEQATHTTTRYATVLDERYNGWLKEEDII